MCVMHKLDGRAASLNQNPTAQDLTAEKRFTCRITQDAASYNRPPPLHGLRVSGGGFDGMRVSIITTFNSGQRQ